MLPVRAWMPPASWVRCVYWYACSCCLVASTLCRRQAPAASNRQGNDLTTPKSATWRARDQYNRRGREHIGSCLRGRPLPGTHGADAAQNRAIVRVRFTCKGLRFSNKDSWHRQTTVNYTAMNSAAYLLQGETWGILFRLCHGVQPLPHNGHVTVRPV